MFLSSGFYGILRYWLENPDLMSKEEVTQLTYMLIKRLMVKDNPNIIDIISDDIDKHNKEILKIDFDEPSAVIVACIFEGQYCFVYLENDKLCNRKELKESEEKLYEIFEKNINRIDEKKMENKSIIEKLKVKVREKILKDEKFLLCTTKQLRKNYTRTLFKEKLGDEYKLLKDLWTTDAPVGVYTDAIDFVEMIWKEMKQKKEE